MKRVTIEGEHTYLLLLKPSDSLPELTLQPIFNCPYQSETQITLNLHEIKYALPYRYMYQLKAMRLVTFNANEYLIVAKDPTYLDKILPFIHSLNP